MAGEDDEEQQHTANDEQRTDSDDCWKGHRGALLDVLLFPCKQVPDRLMLWLTLTFSNGS